MAKPTLVLAFFLATFPGWAEVLPTNPGFPVRETLTYSETIGSDTRPWVVTFVSPDPGTDHPIEVHTLGADTESVYRLDPKTLVSLSSQTLTRGADATVKRTADYQGLNPSPGKDDLVVTDMGSLPAVLRGFPWGRTGFARLLFVGNSTMGAAGVSVELQVVGRESLLAAGRTWDCWHLVTGLGGALGFVVPKTDWWFSAGVTHPLVKSSGPSGGPGSPTRILVLQAWRQDN